MPEAPLSTVNSLASRPKWNGDQLRNILKRYDRSPFMDLLAEWLQCAPTKEDIEKFSAKYPDRYIQAVRQLGQVAGFTDRSEVAIDINLHISSMSDSQLEDRLKSLSKELIIDGQAKEIVDDRSGNHGTHLSVPDRGGSVPHPVGAQPAGHSDPREGDADHLGDRDLVRSPGAG